jgi:hypothetical protein
MGTALEDISRKFAEYLEGRKDAPVRFLGAMESEAPRAPQMLTLPDQSGSA